MYAFLMILTSRYYFRKQSVVFYGDAMCFRCVKNRNFLKNIVF
jgi:hypothetical protein